MNFILKNPLSTMLFPEIGYCILNSFSYYYICNQLGTYLLV